jgi:hypothetical protein
VCVCVCVCKCEWSVTVRARAQGALNSALSRSFSHDTMHAHACYGMCTLSARMHHVHTMLKQCSHIQLD